MEEDIKILEEMKNNCLTKRDYIDEKAERKAQAIENLINKNKEQKEINDILSGVIRPLTELGEEHLEMINLMAIQLSKRQSFMKKVCKKCIYGECIESKPKNCVIDYFKEKARENNEM